MKHGLLSAMLALTVFAQQTPLPSFEVAVIKANANPDGPRLFQAIPGGRINLVNQTVRQLIYSAYQTQDFRVIGGPSWLADDRFDIEAKAEQNAAPQTMLLMIRSLLADRFQLAMHTEMREMPVYRMVLRNGKAGTKLKPTICAMGAVPAQDANGQPACLNREAPGAIGASGVTMSALANRLGRNSQIARPVLNETGLDGAFDFELTFSPDLNSTDPEAVSIFTALQEQLGIKLEASRAPVEVMVIDRVARPSAN